MKELIVDKQIVQIDDEDFDLVSKYKWRLSKGKYTYYVITHNKVDNKDTTLYLHRLVFGNSDKNSIDHIDGNGLNNQKNNLRICTYTQNNRNRNSCINSSSKYKGVSWYKKSCKWRASIQVNKKMIHIGYYNSEEDAAEMYNLHAIKYFKEFAKLNNITTTK